MSAKTLLSIFKKTELASSLLQAAKKPGARIELDRSGGSLQSLVVALLAERGGRAIIVCENGEEAHKLIADLKSLCPSRRILLYPGPELLDEVVLPLRKHAVSYRLRCLSLMDERPLIVTTPEGLVAPTLSPHILKESTIHIEKEASLDRDQFIETLVGRGYRRGPAVVAPGEISVRGGIIDVFSPHEPHPMRIELWGDEVDQVRTFDPLTQRSICERDSYSILPPREFIFSHRALEELEAAGLDTAQAELYVKLREGEVPEGAEQLLPLLPFQRGSLVDYLAKDDFFAWTLSPLATRRFKEMTDRAFAKGALQGQFNKVAGGPQTVFLCGTQGESDDLTSIRSHYKPIDRFGSDLVRLGSYLRLGKEQKRFIALSMPKEGELARLRELLRDQNISYADEPTRADSRVPGLFLMDLHAGFEIEGDRMALITGPDLWEEQTLKEEDAFPVDEDQRVSFADFAELEEGCLVVHVDHGIGKFVGLSSLLIDGVRQEFLEIEYAKSDKLFVPINQLDRVQKFIGVEGGRAPKLNRLSGARWSQVKGRVRKNVEQLAKELLKLYAEREAAPGHAFPADSIWQQEMEDAFPFEETRDQLSALKDLKRDMQKSRPMDRLLCGDVGYGKTELAVRATFKAVQEGKQVAVLVPTTILAQQHYQTFSGRLAPFPVKIAALSRLRTGKENKDTVKKLKKGEIDVAIGTHRLLSKDVAFKDLGLLIVDEEQRFGVKHKEKIKELKTAVDVLTLSATPIPRTLNLAMSGVRDISVINTPPKGRLPIRTVVQEFDDRVVRGAIRKELDRGGQIYYVSNRIDTQDMVVAKVKKLVPEARIRAGHGRMDRAALERLMIDFYNRQYDVLVSTTIIESGLDIPNVNTMIVEDAHRLGLAQLYQLRGRVGRTTRQAYAFLLYPEKRVLPEIAYTRLKAIEEFSDLGSGFKIAMRDLEIRGAGNILGPEQHGFVQSIGFELYTRLLRDAVTDLKGQSHQRARIPCTIELQVDSFIPSDYIVDGDLKMFYYRKLAEVEEYKELEELVQELQDRFGKRPPRLESLIRLVRLKLRCTELGLTNLKQRGQDVLAEFDPDLPPEPELTDKLIRKFRDRVQFRYKPAPGFTLDLAGAKNQAILDLFEKTLW